MPPIIDFKAPLTLYRITSERSDFHTGFGCCSHYILVIWYAPRSENHSALEVIRSSINSESGTLRFKIRTDVYVLETFRSIFLNIIMLYRSRLPRLSILLTISDKNINNTNLSLPKGQLIMYI